MDSIELKRDRVGHFKSFARCYEELRRMDPNGRQNLRHLAAIDVSGAVNYADLCLRAMISLLNNQRRSIEDWRYDKWHEKPKIWNVLKFFSRTPINCERDGCGKSTQSVVDAEKLRYKIRRALEKCNTANRQVMCKLWNLSKIEHSLLKLLLMKRVKKEKDYMRCLRRYTLNLGAWKITGIGVLITVGINTIRGLMYHLHFGSEMIFLRMSSDFSLRAVNGYIVAVLSIFILFMFAISTILFILGRVPLVVLQWSSIREYIRWYWATSRGISRLVKSHENLNYYRSTSIGVFRPPTVADKYPRRIKEKLLDHLETVIAKCRGQEIRITSIDSRVVRSIYIGVSIFCVLSLMFIYERYSAQKVLRGDNQITIFTNTSNQSSYENVALIEHSDSYLFITKDHTDERDVGIKHAAIGQSSVGSISSVSDFPSRNQDSQSSKRISVTAVSSDDVLCIETVGDEDEICANPVTRIGGRKDGVTRVSITDFFLLMFGAENSSDVLDIAPLMETTTAILQEVRKAGDSAPVITDLLGEISSKLDSQANHQHPEVLIRWWVLSKVGEYCDGNVEILTPILFSAHSTKPLHGLEVLEKLKEEVRADRFDKIYVLGLTSPDGDKDHNDWLARERADVVSEFLRDRGGIVGSSIDRIDDYYGEFHPGQGIANSRSVWVAKCRE